MVISYSLEWKKEYELGIAEVDYQHKYFLKLIERISILLSDVNYKDHHKSLILELNAYAKFHFRSEENLMALHNFPKLESHAKEHQHLIQQLYIKQFWVDGNQSHDQCSVLTNFLLSWFFNHTATMDKDFSAFLSKNHNPKPSNTE